MNLSPWTIERITRLERGFAANEPIQKMASAFGISDKAVREKATKLGLYTPQPPSAFWTPERVAVLQTYINAGMPYAEIGELLGCGKNAAIGKARRMGIAEDHPKAKSRTPRPTTVSERLDAINVFPPPGRCVFPIGHPKQDPRFCGSSVDYGSYCTEHRAIAYRADAPDLMAAE